MIIGVQKPRKCKFLRCDWLPYRKVTGIINNMKDLLLLERSTFCFELRVDYFCSLYYTRCSPCSVTLRIWSSVNTNNRTYNATSDQSETYNASVTFACKWLSAGMLRCVTWQKLADVSVVLSTSFFILAAVRTWNLI
jgi:hypothetical protein